MRRTPIDRVQRCGGRHTLMRTRLMLVQMLRSGRRLPVRLCTGAGRSRATALIQFAAAATVELRRVAAAVSTLERRRCATTVAELLVVVVVIGRTAHRRGAAARFEGGAQLAGGGVVMRGGGCCRGGCVVMAVRTGFVGAIRFVGVRGTFGYVVQMLGR